ncbi:hypothetical protein LTR99_006757 [Exophiala xenobiotica]|uniref:Oxysterol-binding protein n=1 Tax=Vermiconidia calcicola TaxID=1690605 RepID=A0AAV9Q1F1_9PEZI|nr:hypothetical protein LTR96_005019 [Exophiala xenobiotica]KAK5531753.1 hypothetical protein LTR25_008083 [Vermiconidia calcicola]KAK5542778.1 hypothetical protein LTR23_005388 [Chaetothyriales sp. CCFEE 6169]KAK5300010.1 hypothetical protein LTR99_006757 [Exophiala xenobiotica]KAK5339242.1 hypothetical protein LTR98_004043 [Exophiala xenobiotica]
MSESSLSDNRSKLKDFVASISVIRGDLSNITAPPFVLDTKSAVELPAFWAERPSVFIAPAASDDPAERALLVLRWFISALRNQQYAGRSADAGVKKPLNAFLGEVFLARWEDEAGTTRLVSEQVSHHPPVTACRVWNEEHGVSAEGYTRQEITFSGNLNIQQIGHATLHLARHNETYLIPLPNVKVKGILTGGPYPELQGTYHIPSTNGYMSTIEFGSKGLFSSSDKKHSFEAKVYREGEESRPLYTVSGNWDGVFVTHDVRKDVQVEKYDVQTARTTPLATDPIDEQDPWESRLAWRGVREALERGDMQGAADAKSKLENGQREMHSADEDGKNWNRLFYTAGQRDEIAETLARKIGQAFDPTDTIAAWTFRLREWQDGKFRKPYHSGLRPDNTRDGSATGKGGPDRPQTGTTGADHTPVAVGAIDDSTTGRRATSHQVIIGAGHAPGAVGAAAESPQHSRGGQQSFMASMHHAVTIPENGDMQEPPIAREVKPDSAPGPSGRETKTDSVPVPNARETKPDIDPAPSPREAKRDSVPAPRARERKTDSVPATAAEKSEPDMDDVDSGVAGMSVREKLRVEDFLRSQYSTSGR